MNRERWLELAVIVFCLIAGFILGCAFCPQHPAPTKGLAISVTQEAENLTGVPGLVLTSGPPPAPDVSIGRVLWHDNVPSAWFKYYDGSKWIIYVPAEKGEKE